MQKTKLAILAMAVVALFSVPSRVEAKEAACVDEYLLCINDASQEEGIFYRTAREFECGVDYYACMKGKAEAK